MKKFVVASAALLGAVTMLACGESVAQQSITISSWGGAFQKAQREAWFNVVEKELGITIKEDTTSGVADIRAQVASGRPPGLSTRAPTPAASSRRRASSEARCRHRATGVPKG